MPASLVDCPCGGGAKEDSESMSMQYNAGEVFQIGMDVELNGQAFYAAAAAGCKDADAEAMLERLGRQEEAHYKTFSRMREQLPEGADPAAVYDPDGQMQAYLHALADSRVFTSETEAAQVARDCASALDVLKVAMQFEKDSVLMFETMREMTRAEWGQEKIDGLIDAEKGHIRMISAMMATLEGGAT